MTTITPEIETLNASHTAPWSAGNYDVVPETTPSRGRWIDSAKREDFVNAMSGAVTGVNVVTTDGPAGRFGITVSAMSSVSADPPMVLACINRRSPACEAVRVNGVFCINVLSARQRHVADTFAGRLPSGKPYDFANAIWTQDTTGVPRLVDATSAFDCVLERAYDVGSHTIFVGRVVAARGGSESPLLYTERTYGYPCHWD
ncbi:MAG: flavin reductase family protein [Acidiferrobacterales bacterium]|nr:flavin reductase family protein [Acidiferrobacterales bacterium]